MNIKRIKRLTFAIPVALLFLLTGCLKEHDGFIDFTQTQDFVILTGAGLSNFKASNVIMASDTVRKTITVDLASANNDNGPVTVTVGLDPNAASIITSYNTANSADYQLMPSNAYKLTSTQVTVPAGQHYATTTLEIYQSKLDPAISYMVPISITNGGGKNLSSNQNTIYYNVVGNPLGGNYTQNFYRFNGTTDTTGAPSSGYEGHTSLVIPVTKTSVLLPEDYLKTFVGSTAGVTLSFTNTNGTLSNFSVSLDAATTQGLKDGGFTVTTPPKLVSYQIVGNASTKYAGSTFRIYMSLINSSGATRTVIDNFVKQ